MQLPKLEEGAAIAVISFGILEVFRLYTTTAPSLADIRRAPKSDWYTAQALVDANVMTGILVFVMGGASLILMRRTYPVILLALTFALIAWYYNAVFEGPSNVREIERMR
jgi:hypothetical protein